MEDYTEHAQTGETLEDLSREFQTWLDANGLPQKSADELLGEDEPSLDEAQRIFLTEFMRRWETAADVPETNDKETQIKILIGANSFDNSSPLEIGEMLRNLPERRRETEDEERLEIY